MKTNPKAKPYSTYLNAAHNPLNGTADGSLNFDCDERCVDTSRQQSSMPDEETPRTIFYCWFGHGNLSKTAENALASWRRYAPGYRIVRCDESVFDVDSHPWTHAAYAAGKYAYVADYVRFWAIYNYGGIYMDLGSELIRDITSLCEHCSPFTAIEEMSRTANAGLIMASPRHNPVISEVLRAYDDEAFSDNLLYLNEHTVNEMFTSVLERHGFIREDRRQIVGGWTLLPSSAFSPVYGLGGFHIKRDTYSVHHYSASWVEPKFKTKRKIFLALTPFIGRRAANVVGRIIAELKHNGLLGGVKNLSAVTSARLNHLSAGSCAFGNNAKSKEYSDD